MADGHFAEAVAAASDAALFRAFRQALQDDGHITSAEGLAAFDFAVALRAAAPRIEAHYQLYNTSVRPLLGVLAGDGCLSWVYFGGRRYCSPELEQPRGSLRSRESVVSLSLSFFLSLWRARGVSYYLFAAPF